MNKLFLTGRVVRDASTGVTATGRGWVGFTLAVDRDYKNPDGTRPTDFISVMYGLKDATGAQKFASYIKKGTALEVEGKVNSRTVDLPDGKKNAVLTVNADRIGFGLTNASHANGNAVTTTPTQPNTAPQQTSPTTTPVVNTAMDNIAIDDLPF